MAKKVLACDFGSSGAKIIMGVFDGDKLNFKNIYNFTNGGVYLNRQRHWDILHLFSELKTGIKKAVEKEGVLDSIGIDTWGVDYGLLDQNGVLMSNPYHYRDRRTEGLKKEVFKQISEKKIFQETGIQIMEINTLFQLYADLKLRPWILNNARSLLFTPDLLNYFLTGKKNNELTIASTSQLYNTKSKQLSTVIFEKLGLPKEIMPNIIQPASKIGDLLETVKKECGIKANLPVIAVGSHDTASAVAAVPFKDKSSAFLSSGSWSLLGVELETTNISDASFKAQFTNELGIANKVRFLKNITGLWLIQECKRIWNRQGLDLSYSEITRAAEKSAPFKYKLDPDYSGFINPDNMIKAIKNYCKKTGQKTPKSPGEIARAIYESLALNYKKNIQKLEKIVDQEINTIHMVGGGIQAEILCQYTANISQRLVVAGPIEATAFGNIITQLIALGEISNLKEGRELINNSIKLKEYYPR